ncbi:MAG TPA: hypothetical protein VJB36_02385 [Methylomirabilota bacterium]|nr:hypothetical protein [Methylomirabilota bacterium]
MYAAAGRRVNRAADDCAPPPTADVPTAHLDGGRLNGGAVLCPATPLVVVVVMVA